MPTNLELNSPCKINLLLNILGRRADGFHDLETLMYPVPLYDRLVFSQAGTGVSLSCSHPQLPTDSRNLVYRAAEMFLARTTIVEGVKIHLQKEIPHAAGLGGGSGNAATTLLGLNQLFDFPLTPAILHELAESLGSDIPFFLQEKPALATGRGEHISPLEFFPALNGYFILLIHPGFGISTPWAYQQLASFPQTLNGTPGRAAKLVSLLETNDWTHAEGEFFNSLEAPALEKYPILELIQVFLRQNGATVALMSGSGSATFGLIPDEKAGVELREKFFQRFGEKFWTALVPARG